MKECENGKRFKALEEITRSNGVRENPEVTIARVQKAGIVVKRFSLRSQGVCLNVTRV